MTFFYNRPKDNVTDFELVSCCLFLRNMHKKLTARRSRVECKNELVGKIGPRMLVVDLSSIHSARSQAPELIYGVDVRQAYISC